ncbi:MAG: chalcone isomerase family protein [Burkholderiaceae bacterium]|nr:chalcone isomerase family protein [Burkholderiaceae bacterium]
MLSNSCLKRRDPAWRRGRSALLLCAMLCSMLYGLLASGVSSAASWRDELPRAEVLGDGELSWLGFRIYHATLWSEQRPFQSERPFALQLQYHRSISRQRLVQTSLDEIERLQGNSVDAATLAQWNTKLLTAFTDVAPGDELTGVYVPGHGMRFYNRQRLLADIDDVRLARAFFGIWLNERTRDQGLRRKLLGGAP